MLKCVSYSSPSPLDSLGLFHTLSSGPLHNMFISHPPLFEWSLFIFPSASFLFLITCSNCGVILHLGFGCVFSMSLTGKANVCGLFWRPTFLLWLYLVRCSNGNLRESEMFFHTTIFNTNYPVRFNLKKQ